MCGWRCPYTAFKKAWNKTPPLHHIVNKMYDHATLQDKPTWTIKWTAKLKMKVHPINQCMQKHTHEKINDIEHNTFKQLISSMCESRYAEWNINMHGEYRSAWHCHPIITNASNHHVKEKCNTYHKQSLQPSSWRHDHIYTNHRFLTNNNIHAYT